jgi:hypothetical protein
VKPDEFNLVVRKMKLAESWVWAVAMSRGGEVFAVQSGLAPSRAHAWERACEVWGALRSPVTVPVT